MRVRLFSKRNGRFTRTVVRNGNSEINISSTIGDYQFAGCRSKHPIWDFERDTIIFYIISTAAIEVIDRIGLLIYRIINSNR